MVSRPSYSYNGNLYTQKDSIHFETGPRVLWHFSVFPGLTRNPGTSQYKDTVLPV